MPRSDASSAVACRGSGCSTAWLTVMPISAIRFTTPAPADAFLARYPPLKGWSHTPDAPNSVLWHNRGNGSAEELEVLLPSALTISADADSGRLEALKRSTLYRGPSDAYAFPALGSMAGLVPRLLAWWAILFGLSILARYEPASWAEIIDIDSSSAANAVEHLLDQLIVVVPHMALMAIKDVAGR
ncbi:YaaC family protein [Streptomyces sp. NPDC048508]|uniref:YaaC family protein n=1 Tax=Streptomyces sp. NPDC048508 TaxID=3365561 RepID=UPI003720E342